ncbi:tyrosine-type recombinase/integrase [Sedimentitalea nanhaiensis]|nr:site-specific integrase [Sedimentitalea nanhaiensis]
MKIKLTDRFLRSLTPPEAGRLEVSDTERRGLRFRLSASGKAVWMYEKRVKGGPKRKHTLGAWPRPVSLSEARARALEIEAEAGRGVDRIALAEAELRASKHLRDNILTVREVFEVYDRLHLSNLRTRDERLRQLEQSLAVHLDRSVLELSRKDIQKAVDDKAASGRKAYANRIRAALAAFTKWAWIRGYIPEDVGAGVAKAIKEKARERVLSVREVRQIWKATFEAGEVWGPMFRLLILTCQRRGEILGLRWDEVDLESRRIVKPGSRTKNGKPHTTHLSQPAFEELRKLDAGRTELELVFTTTGTTPVSGIGKAKARLDGLLPDDFQHWRLHDIRTGFATAMAEAGESESVVDRILNHSASGSAPSAVARVYNQSEMLPQRAAALDRWSEVVTQKPCTIITMGGE